MRGHDDLLPVLDLVKVVAQLLFEYRDAYRFRVHKIDMLCP